jgi:putative transposase
VELAHPDFSIRRQCELLGVNRAGLYHQPRGESEENLRLMRLLDEQYTRTPFYERRRMRAWLHDQGYEVNSKRVARLMELIGIAAIRRFHPERAGAWDRSTPDNGLQGHADLHRRHETPSCRR